ncbi:MAG TPA: hypothetical protein VFF65_11555 [Phycisphaerales bacterium]|nr:hypothetical protein [Phycisphaerales bacterium]
MAECARCRYDLTGLPLASSETGWVCPECGGWTPLEVEPLPPLSALQGLAWAGVAGLVCLGLMTIPMVSLAVTGDESVAVAAGAVCLALAAGCIEVAAARSMRRPVRWRNALLLAGCFVGVVAAAGGALALLGWVVTLMSGR